MGQRLVIVSSPLGGCVSFTPFRLSSVASTLSLPESWLFFLLWICRCYCWIQWRRPSRKLLRFPCGLGLPVLSMVGVLFDFFPVLPWVFSPGVGVAPSPRFDFTGLVVWSLLAPRSWELPSQSSAFSRSVAFWRLCSASYSPPLVSSLTAAHLGIWHYGLAIAALPLVSRPWTGLCWSHLLSVCS